MTKRPPAITGAHQNVLRPIRRQRPVQTSLARPRKPLPSDTRRVRLMPADEAQHDGQTTIKRSWNCSAGPRYYGPDLQFCVELRGFEPLTPSMRTMLRRVSKAALAFQAQTRSVIWLGPQHDQGVQGSSFSALTCAGVTARK